MPIVKRLSLEISSGYIFNLISGEVDGDLGLEGKYRFDQVNGIAFRLAPKFYTSAKMKHEGFYVNPLILYKYIHYPSSTQSVQMYGGQIIFGYKFHLKKISIESYSGIGYKSVSYGKNGIYTSSYKTIQLGIAIGYILHKK